MKKSKMVKALSEILYPQGYGTNIDKRGDRVDVKLILAEKYIDLMLEMGMLPPTITEQRYDPDSNDPVTYLVRTNRWSQE